MSSEPTHPHVYAEPTPESTPESTINPYPIIDAYCHVGLPRFGTAEDALAVLGLAGIEYGVLVLGPDVPDYATLFQAMQAYPDRVRGVGIPFGRTPEQVRETVILQVMGGALGVRIQEEAHLTDPVVLETLGRSGRWIYGINVLRTGETVRVLLDWLEAYPDAHLAAPHFLRPAPLFDGSQFDDLKRALLQHPRFYPIFSRHGGVGSAESYPHADLRPWVEQVLELTTWDRVMWGSEYPVIFWRNEGIRDAANWLTNLLPAADPMDIWSCMGRNAARAILSKERPTGEPVDLPDWIAAQFDHRRTVPLFPAGLDMNMDQYAHLHAQYVQVLGQDPEISFAQYIMQRLL